MKQKIKFGGVMTSKLQTIIRSNLAIFVFVAVIGFSLVSCGLINENADNNGGTDGTGGGGDPTKGFTSIEALEKWLKAKPDNTATTAYIVKLNVNDLGSESAYIGSLGYMLKEKKYISLDLSDSTFTSIKMRTFSNCTSLTSIIIPKSVTSIDESAFWGCTSLTNVTIGNGVKTIGQNAFRNCGLISITIPDSVTNIGSESFRDCKSLTSLTIGNNVVSIGQQAFDNCTSLSSLTIGNSVINIGASAFTFCTSLTSVTIPDSVINIESKAFSYCKNLSSVTIGNSVTSIGWQTFLDCTSLTSINIPKSVTTIGWWAFEGCTSLTNVIFATGSDIQNDNFGTYAFPEGSSGGSGDTLKTAYRTGKAGTYTRALNGATWTKN